MHSKESRAKKNAKVQEKLGNFKYININKQSASSIKVLIPKRVGSGFNVIYAPSVRKAISIRNKVGVRIWGDLWSAVLSGYVDTIKSETASVSVYKRTDKRSGLSEWTISFRQLENSKQVTRSFSCQKYGEKKAHELAIEYAKIETESRLERLSNWDPRIIRKPRDSSQKNTINRGSGAKK